MIRAWRHGAARALWRQRAPGAAPGAAQDTAQGAATTAATAADAARARSSAEPRPAARRCFGNPPASPPTTGGLARCFGRWRGSLRQAGRGLALAAAAGLLAACAGAGVGVVVGGGPLAETEPRGGIGGTGITTGVLGTVTGFGSVHVNGLTVGTADRLAESPLGPVALETGHVVELLAEPATAGAPAGTGLTARRLAVAWPLVGPITAVGDNRLAVMGVPVTLEPGAPIPGPETLAPGRRVAVSGLWRDGAVVASRLDPAPEGPDLAAGVVVHGAAAAAGPGGATARPGGRMSMADASAAEGAAADGSPQVRIGRLPLAEAADLAAGAHWRLRGRWDGARFVVETAAPGRPLLRAGPLARLSVEGYLTEGPGGRAVIDGLGVAFDDGARVERLRRERAVFIGRLDGRFHVEHGIPLPEGAAARAEALDALGNGLAPTRGAVETR